MDLKEAIDWLDGNRSMTNIVPSDPLETWTVRISQADAAMTEQAYWIAKAHKENLSFIMRMQEQIDELKTTIKRILKHNF